MKTKQKPKRRPAAPRILPQPQTPLSAWCKANYGHSAAYYRDVLSGRKCGPRRYDSLIAGVPGHVPPLPAELLPECHRAATPADVRPGRPKRKKAAPEAKPPRADESCGRNRAARRKNGKDAR